MCYFSSFIGNGGFIIPWGFFFIPVIPFIFFLIILPILWVKRNSILSHFLSLGKNNVSSPQLADEIQQLRLEIEKLKNQK